MECIIIVSKDATEGYEKVLGDQLRKDPRLLVSDIFSALENVIDHKAAYPGVYIPKLNIITQ